MIINKVEDYYDIHESIQVINEANVFKWLKNKFKQILGINEERLTNLIAPPIVDSAINSKTGELNNRVIDVDEISDTDVPLKEVFDSIKRKISKGKYFQAGLNYLQDYSEKADANFAANVANKVLKDENEGMEDEGKETNISDEAGKELGKRSIEYEQAFKNKYKHLNSVIEKEIKDFISKAHTDDAPKFEKVINIRYNNAKSVLLFIEYEIKKKRWKLDDIGDLPNEMATAYKKVVTFEKDLAANIGEKREEIKTENVDKFKDLVKKNYSIGDIVNLKSKRAPGATKKAEIKDFGEDRITVLGEGSTKPVEITYEEFNKWLVPNPAKRGI